MSDNYQREAGFNPHFNIKKRTEKNPEHYINGLIEGNRYILSECITLIESNIPKKRNLGLFILEETIKISNPESIRVGITGTPGVGKSTLIETFGLHIIDKGYKPAIITIDPSSKVTHGSILGDKTRMPNLSTHPLAYIRPSAAGNILGGTATYTKDVIRLCEVAGYNFIIVETVGIGQSETDIKDITDVTLLLLQPGAGDEIQGIKRGIVESGDVFVITKSDGPQKTLAHHTQQFYTQALKLFHHDIASWTCPVLCVSALEKKGMDNILESIANFISFLKIDDLLEKRRKAQDILWFQKHCTLMFQNLFWAIGDYKNTYLFLISELNKGQISTTKALDIMKVSILNKLQP